MKKCSNCGKDIVDDGLTGKNSRKFCKGGECRRERVRLAMRAFRVENGKEHEAKMQAQRDKGILVRRKCPVGSFKTGFDVSMLAINACIRETA